MCSGGEKAHVVKMDDEGQEKIQVEMTSLSLLMVLLSTGEVLIHILTRVSKHTEAVTVK